MRESRCPSIRAISIIGTPASAIQVAAVAKNVWRHTGQIGAAARASARMGISLAAIGGIAHPFPPGAAPRSINPAATSTRSQVNSGTAAARAAV